MYLNRIAEKLILDLLGQYPVIAIVGPRQCGKSTLAKYLLDRLKDGIYLDLELPSDLRRLEDPERFLGALATQLAAPDRALLETESLRDSMLRDFREAYKQGADGHFIDGQLAMTRWSWGFSLSSVSVPLVLLHGDADTLVTRPMAEYLTCERPQSTCYLVPEVGRLLTEHPGAIRQMRAALHGEAA